MSRRIVVIFLLGVVASGLALAVDAPSRDSRYGETDIFVVNADASGRRNLTKSPLLENDRPALSPDGRTLAFVRNRNEGGYGLFVMPARGGLARELLPNASAPTWSPDGAHIAFNRGPRGPGYEAGIVRRDGSGLTSIPDASNPTWLSGKRIAFEIPNGDWTDAIAVAKADGSERRVVVRGEDVGLLEVLGPVVAPNSRSIAFTAANPEPRHVARVYSMNLTAGSLPRLIRGGREPSWSPTGRQLVFTDYHRLWTVRADGTRRRSFPYRGISPQLPSWSPDGTRIAFIGTRSGGRHDLVVMNVRHRWLRVVAGRVEPRRPVWSPNGRRLYYVAESGS